MSTAHKTAEEVKEHHDTPEVLAKKIDILVDLVLKSKRMATWTGAGISTSTGIPDFRGPNGKWTLQAANKTRDPAIKVVGSLQATPSPTHMAIVGLLRAGLLKKVISSNCDGLHRRSGVMSHEIAELHGNGNKAQCDKCKQFALVDARARCATKAKEHQTGQSCPYGDCAGEMGDTIINFGEYLLPEVSRDANTTGSKADLLLGLGSSFRVITCDALEDIQTNGGKLVIVNLQKTPYDNVCALRIFATTDEVMTALMAKLKLAIPTWVLHRYVTVDPSAKAGSTVVAGIDETGLNYGWVAKAETLHATCAPASTAPVAATAGGGGAGAATVPLSAKDIAAAAVMGKAAVASKKNFHSLVIANPVATKAGPSAVPTHVQLHTFNHRGEGTVCVPYPQDGVPTTYHLECDMSNGVWSTAPVAVAGVAKSAANK